MRLVSAAILTGTLSAMVVEPAVAADECMCTGNGQRFELGTVVCLQLPDGNRLARCGKVLNNTSWEMIGDSCPLTSAEEEKKEAASAPISYPEPG